MIQASYAIVPDFLNSLLGDAAHPVVDAWYVTFLHAEHCSGAFEHRRLLFHPIKTGAREPMRQVSNRGPFSGVSLKTMNPIHHSSALSKASAILEKESPQQCSGKRLHV